MSDTVIRVEGLGKKYQLQHSTRNGQRYHFRTLRDTLSERAMELLRGGRTRRFEEELWALREINFEIKKGEVVGIIGRNGAGKSTLLKILSRITEPTAGKIYIKGRVASLLEVGTGFHPELTGRENIYLNGAILGMSRAEIRRKFDEIVDFAEVQQFIDLPVKRFSSGMYLRLAFAVAANLEPEILVVDEVLAVGDAEFQKKCLGKMGEVSQREGRTILFVSHQLMAIERLCSRALLIDKGQLRMESSDVRSVIRFYLSGEEPGSARGEWRNPSGQFSNPWFQLERLFLADADGAPLRMPARMDAEVWLHIVADFRKLDPALTIGYAIYAESGDLLYISCHTDLRQEEWPRLKLGRTVLRGKIPPHLLNEGTYRLDLVAALHNRQWLFEPGSGEAAVVLELQGGASGSPFRNAKRRGFLAPVVPWEIYEAE
jgi:homopolymeric O-antigen transport system ATP-binding protein